MLTNDLQIGEARDRLEQAEQALQEQKARVKAAREQVEQILREIGGELGLRLAREPRKKTGARKPRAERWRVEKFLPFLSKAHPATDEVRRLLPRLHISRATLYKYAIVDTDGRYHLNELGRETLDHLLRHHPQG